MNCTFSKGCHVDNSSTDNPNIESLLVQKNIEPLISNKLTARLEFYTNIIAFFVTSSFGIMANVVNIIVYWRLGLKDSITLGFFSLSMSDIVIVITTLQSACIWTAKTILPDSNIDFPSVHFVSSGTIRVIVCSISNVITTFLSIERCCCVIVPFKVKFLFTRKRTAIFLIIVVIAHFIFFIPFFATQDLRWNQQTSINGTFKYKLSVYFTPERPTVERMSYILFSILTPTLSQVVATVCAMILIKGLKDASHFRAAAGKAPGITNVSNPIKTKSLQGNSVEPEKNGNSKLSQRDVKLMRTMVILVVLLSISNMPLMAIIYAQMVVPELNMGRPYHNTFALSHTLVYLLSNLNASLNVLQQQYTL